MMSIPLAKAHMIVVEWPRWQVLLVYALLFALTLVSVPLAIIFRVGRRQSVEGPLRLATTDSPLVFFAPILVGVFAWIGGQSAALSLNFIPDKQRMVLAGAAGLVLLFPALLFAVSFLRRDGLRLMGLRANGIVPGMVAGAIGLLVYLPWLMWSTLALQWLVKSLGIEADQEHEIFHIWNDRASGPAFHALAFASAVLLAPLPKRRCSAARCRPA